MRKRLFPLYPLLFAAYPVLEVYSKNTGNAQVSDIVRPLVISLVCAVVLLLATHLLLRNRTKTGICVSIFLILFLSYGHLLRAFTRVLRILGVDWNPALHPVPALVAWGLALTLCLTLTIRSKRKLIRIGQFFTVMSVLLTAMALFRVGAAVASGSMSGKPVGDSWDTMIAAERKAAAANLHGPAGARLPDIYYIILDMHARGDVLKRDFGYDNSALLGDLTKKGFYIAKRSRANYPCTQFSLPSSLNYEYMDPILRWENDPTGSNMAKTVSNNRLARVLQVLGYKYVFLGSGWSITAHCSYADLTPARGAFTYTELESTLISKSVLGMVNATRTENALRNGTTSQFEELAQIPEIKAPTFTFAHIMCPHDPWLFDEGGNLPADTFTSTPETTRVGYARQAHYVDEQVRALVGKILARSSTPPIIVIQSDHGPLSPELMTRWIMNGNLKGPDGKVKLDLRDRVPILNAYYLPGDGKKYLYDSITPVNTWRVILDHYFGAHLGLLKDVTYAPTNTWVKVGGAFDIKTFRPYTKPD